MNKYSFIYFIFYAVQLIHADITIYEEDSPIAALRKITILEDHIQVKKIKLNYKSVIHFAAQIREESGDQQSRLRSRAFKKFEHNGVQIDLNDFYTNRNDGLFNTRVSHLLELVSNLHSIKSMEIIIDNANENGLKAIVLDGDNIEKNDGTTPRFIGRRSFLKAIGREMQNCKHNVTITASVGIIQDLGYETISCCKRYFGCF